MTYASDLECAAPSTSGSRLEDLSAAALRSIYPEARRAADVPQGDVFMLVDCRQMVKPDVFLKMGGCMRDPLVGVALAPEVRSREGKFVSVR